MLKKNTNKLLLMRVIVLDKFHTEGHNISYNSFKIALY